MSGRAGKRTQASSLPQFSSGHFSGRGTTQDMLGIFYSTAQEAPGPGTDAGHPCHPTAEAGGLGMVAPRRARVSGSPAAFEASVGEKTRFWGGPALLFPNSEERGSPTALPFALPWCIQGRRVGGRSFARVLPQAAPASLPPHVVPGDFRPGRLYRKS